MKLGERLKELIDEKGIEQQEFAKLFNISPQAVSGYIKNYRTPSDDLKIKIASYFNVSVDYLICNTDIRNYNSELNNIENLEEEFPEGIQVLRRASKKLSPEARKKMIKLMNAFLDED